ncbi:MAG: hypothetical protein KDA79_23365 [Planctomycetaceae bacterium]|nr:hypothetical protein [Planctomycetaceae bacterium]
MSNRPAAELTLRELFLEAERTSRELVDHIERNLLPRNQELRSLAAPARMEEVRDVTIRTSAASLLESSRFSDKLSRRLTELSRAIDEQVQQMVNG